MYVRVFCTVKLPETNTLVNVAEFATVDPIIAGLAQLYPCKRSESEARFATLADCEVFAKVAICAALAKIANCAVLAKVAKAEVLEKVANCAALAKVANADVLANLAVFADTAVSATATHTEPLEK